MEWRKSLVLAQGCHKCAVLPIFCTFFGRCSVLEQARKGALRRSRARGVLNSSDTSLTVARHLVWPVPTAPPWLRHWEGL